MKKSMGYWWCSFSIKYICCRRDWVFNFRSSMAFRRGTSPPTTPNKHPIDERVVYYMCLGGHNHHPCSFSGPASVLEVLTWKASNDRKLEHPASATINSSCYRHDYMTKTRNNICNVRIHFYSPPPSQVELLCTALHTVDRVDLAGELKDKEQDYRRLRAGQARGKPMIGLMFFRFQWNKKETDHLHVYCGVSCMMHYGPWFALYGIHVYVLILVLVFLDSV